MAELSALQKRILLAAVGNEGHLILWVLKNGRYNLPGFTEDVKDATRTLENAGLLAPREGAGQTTSRFQGLPPGSYVFDLTEKGRQAARVAVGRAT